LTEVPGDERAHLSKAILTRQTCCARRTDSDAEERHAALVLLVDLTAGPDYRRVKQRGRLASGVRTIAAAWLCQSRRWSMPQDRPQRLKGCGLPPP
jgi:hypothetical protein